jgi:AcrR family transcriptional regulator
MARTPSLRAHRKVLEATAKLVAEHGIDATSMDAVARESGVSKATIYKHWADKQALLLETLAMVSGLTGRPNFDTGNPRAGMVAVLSYKPAEHAALRDRLTPHFAAHAATHPEFGQAWRNMVMEPPRRELTHLLDKAVKAGLLNGEFDREAALAMLLGPILYWHIFRKQDRSMFGDRTSALAEAVVASFFRAHRRGKV